MAFTVDLTTLPANVYTSNIHTGQGYVTHIGHLSVSEMEAAMLLIIL